MEWTIPLHAVIPNNIRIGALQRGSKITAPISYSNAIADMQSLSMILPAMTIKSYDSVTGQLVLIIPAALKKLQAIQERVIQEIRQKQECWFPEYRNDHSGFQPMVEGGVIRLYCPVGVGGAYDIHMWSGEWSRAAALEPGSRVRIVLRIQGVSFHQTPTGVWSGKYRLQHRILGLFWIP